MDRGEIPLSTFFFAGLGRKLPSSKRAAFSSVNGFPPESRFVKIFVRQPFNGAFFNGNVFAAKRNKAYEFKSVRDAIDLIRCEKWFDAELVIAYDDESEFRILGHYFSFPDEIAVGLARCKATVLRRSSVYDSGHRKI
jgi:hypothetical protein